MRDVLLVLAVFLACTVEAVEALTIVLAVGISRGWRSALQGVAAGLLTLAVIVATLGPALSLVPLDALRLVVGGLLLIFGLGWLRKAILRASGFKAVHDEDAIYARQLAAAHTAGRTRRAAVDDWYAFTLSFKGVLLEGLEVAFIVVTFGSNQGSGQRTADNHPGHGDKHDREGRPEHRERNASAGEHLEVRGRGSADLVRHVLGCRRSRCQLAWQ